MSPTIYGLIRVEKVLQGDIEAILENYSLDVRAPHLTACLLVNTNELL